ncbi:MAG: citrate lyase holo-[acyl-carrier protein] synthase [Clostridiaceae bacterium]
MKSLIENETNGFNNTREIVTDMIKKYKKTTIVIRVNSINYKKNSSLFNEILENVNKWLVDFFKQLVLLRLYSVDKEGPMIMLVVNKCPIDTKKMIVDIEDKHILGRCLNIKVLNEHFNEVTRETIGVNKAVCPLCNEVDSCCNCCSKNKDEDMLAYMRNSFLEYKFNFQR